MVAAGLWKKSPQCDAMRFIWKNLNKFLSVAESVRAAPVPYCCRSMPKKKKKHERTKSHVWRSRLVSSESLNCGEHMNANGIRAIYEFHMFSLWFSTTHCASHSQCNADEVKSHRENRIGRGECQRSAQHRAHSARCTLTFCAYSTHVVIFIGMQKQQIENNNLLF